MPFTIRSHGRFPVHTSVPQHGSFLQALSDLPSELLVTMMFLVLSSGPVYAQNGYW